MVVIVQWLGLRFVEPLTWVRVPIITPKPTVSDGRSADCKSALLGDRKFDSCRRHIKDLRSTMGDTNSNQRKAALLGMPLGTAANKLRKDLLFSLAKETGKDACFRCGNAIRNVDEFSVEHKTSWMGSANPKEAFFDLGNIAFSHLTCNVAAGRITKVWQDEKKRKLANSRNRYEKNSETILRNKRNGYHRRKETESIAD